MKMSLKKIIKAIRFSEDEYEKLAKHARRCEMPVSSYIRKVALGHKPRGKDLTHAINQLAKQGGLLKHLHNEGLGNGKETARLLTEISKTIRMLGSIERGKQEKEEVTE